MGIKSQYITKSFKLGGLIFDSEKDYKSLKTFNDKIINIINLNLDKDSTNDNINNIFKSINPINVTETYPDAYDEVYEIFNNAASLLLYEDTLEYKVGSKFFDKIKVNSYKELDY